MGLVKDHIHIPHEKSPKIALTANYAIIGDSSSHRRRNFEFEVSPTYSADHISRDKFERNFFDIMKIPSAFSSNGDAFASHNKTPKDGEDVETEFPLENFPPPVMLWERYKKYRGIKDADEKVATKPYHTDSSGKEPRYYQTEAINRVVEAVAGGEKRLLLVMATGTGKTYTTFQIIWRLWKAKMVRRVLFLVDRNIVADAVVEQAVKDKPEKAYEVTDSLNIAAEPWK